MAGKSIVILGGGFGGAAAARTLRALLSGEHTVTLVDRQIRSYICGSMPWLIVGERRPSQISRSLGALLGRGVNYIQAEAQGIDIANRKVFTGAGPLQYDYLILATGAEYDWEAVPGSSREHSFYSLDTARRLRDALRRFRGGKIVIAISRLPYKCPPAPYEPAMLLDWLYIQRGVRKDVDLHVFTPEPSPLGVIGPVASASFVAYLQKRGIQVHTGQSLTQVDHDGRRATFLSGESVRHDLLITVPVHRAASWIKAAGLADGSGWVPVDSGTLATKRDSIYAIGDVTFLAMANGSPLPKAGVFASAQGETVARNLAAEIEGGEKTPFPGTGFCFVDHGGGKAALVRGGFLEKEKPVVAMASPSVRWYRKKVRFERDWRRWKI